MSRSTSTATVRRATALVADGLPIGQRDVPCVCTRPRGAHGGVHSTGGVAPVWDPAAEKMSRSCRKYRADTAWDLAYKAVEGQASTLGRDLRRADRLMRDLHYRQAPRKPGEWSIGASDTGTCPRKIQYRNKPPDDLVRASEDTREALAGTMLHEGITARMRLLFPWREFGGLVRIPGLDRDSEFDAYDPITCEVEDYKSAGRWRWDQVGEFGPSEDVWMQAMLYAYALIAAGRVVRTVRVSYYHREKGHDETFVRDYDETLALDALDLLLGYARSLDLGIDLPRTETGPGSSEMCRRCFARLHCWNIEPAKAAGRSPESYTILGAEPLDESVVWAIAEKVDAGKAERDGKARHDQAKTLLEGIQPGRYGEFEGYTSGGGGGDDHKAYAATLLDVLKVPEGERLAPEQVEALPVPQKPKYSYIRWGKARKATLAREAKEAAGK